MNKKTLILVAFALGSLTSCAKTRASYFPDYTVCLDKKASDGVSFFHSPPKKAAIKIGTIEVNGNEYASSEHLIKGAKEKAAEFGGDYILAEEAGTDTKTIYNPGYTSRDTKWDESKKKYESKDKWVPPSITQVNNPWAEYSVWVYTPSQLGVKTDGSVITGFQLNSSAESSGLQVGDVIIGINNIDIASPKLASQMLLIEPGDVITLSVRRNNQRLDFSITAVPNY